MVREAIAFAKFVIRRKYPNLQIPDPAIVRAAIAAKKVILLHPDDPRRSPPQIWREDRRPTPPTAKVLKPPQWQNPHSGGG